MPQGEAQAARHDTRFKPGVSGNPLGRAASQKLKLDAKMNELAADYGGVAALTASERVLIEQAAKLLLRNPSTAEDAVRIANTVARLMRVVQRGRASVSAALAPSAKLADWAGSPDAQEGAGCDEGAGGGEDASQAKPAPAGP